MKAILALAAGLIAAATLPVAQAAPGEGAASAESRLPAVELTPQLIYQILAADIAAQRGDIGAAWSTYMSAARATRDPRLAQRATDLALGARALEEALQAARLWRELDPGSVDASRTLEALWASGGRIDDLEGFVAERLAKARREGGLDAAYAELQRVLARVPDRQAAWQALERLSSPDLGQASARLARAQVAAAAELGAVATAEAQEAMRLAPTDVDVWVAAAQVLYRQPASRAAALQALEGLLARQPRATDARSAYARLLLAETRIDEARAQFERLLADAPDSAEALVALAQMAYESKQGALAATYLQRFLALPSNAGRDPSPVLLFLAQIAEEGGQTQEALLWLGQVPRGNSFLPATLRRALLLGKSGQVDAARQLLRDTEVTSAADRARLVSAEAEVLRQARRLDEALAVLTAGLERLPDQPDLLYDHGMAAERVNRIDLMEQSLRRLIALRPDHAHAYNALGYTLADRNLRLDEARALIERAVALAPQDAHILDSLGWVLFRQQDYPRAIETLRRAYGMQAEVDIAAHLGEALWVSGQREEARAVWREAQRREPDNTTLRETLTRLNVAL